MECHFCKGEMRRSTTSYAISRSGYHFVIENGQALSPREAAERQKKQTWNAAVAGRNFFRPEHRRHYAFELLPPDSIDGRPAHVLSIQPRPGGRNLVSGTIWLHRDNFEILRLDVRPEDRPRFVNKLRMIIDFDEVDDGVWLPVRIDADACGGFLFYNRCLRIHEEWYRFQINAGLPDSIFASTEP